MAIHDNYLPCEQYSAAPESENYPGFKSWFDEATNLWYFAVVTNTGRVVLRSEGYTSEAARNNGIESVMRNRDLEARYSVAQDEEDGNWYIILRAGNRQEIARSCPFSSESDATAGLASCSSTYTESLVSESLESSSSASSEGRIIEDYLACEDYRDQPASSYAGFTSFYNESDAQHYFALVDASGNVLLRSEGYSSEAGRNNGIESVQRNRDLEDRYSVSQYEDGNYYLSLKAGNRQEIARSCGHSTEAGAWAIRSYCNSTYVQTTSVGTSEFTPTVTRITSEPVMTTSTEEIQVTRVMSEQINTTSNEEVQVTRITSEQINTVSNEEVQVTRVTSEQINTKSTVAPSVTRITAEPIVTKSTAEPTVTRVTGDTIKLTSSVAPSEVTRVVAEPIVLKTQVIEKVEIETPAPAPTRKYDGYMPCEEHKGHPESSYEGFNAFRSEINNQYYFSMVDDDGNVILKSEGYDTIAARDNGIESVMRNREIKERWVQEKDEHGYYLSLRAGNKQEIGRTCHHENESSLMGWWMPFSAAWVWGRRKVEIVETKGEAVVESIQVQTPVVETPVAIQVEERMAPPKVEIEVPKKEKEYQPQWKKDKKKPTPPPVVEKKPIVEEAVVYSKPVEPYVAPPVYVEPEVAASGGFDWRWLLGGLLLAGLAWMLMKNCNDKPKVEIPTATVAPPSTPTPAPAPAVETPAVAAPVATGCQCNGNADPLFNIGSATPKSLSRLGTNPEFGSLHGLSSEEFLAKLKRAYKRSNVDKAFLDRITKAMGYSGFSDLTIDMISEENLAAGTVGNIGYSPAHKTLLAKLDTQPRDLMSFRIKAKNGCDLNFMRTCGNHMFVCNK
jgi:uncharacterized protein YegP (UPF0339 family)